jgi:hypothetical protein
VTARFDATLYIRLCQRLNGGGDGYGFRGGLNDAGIADTADQEPMVPCSFRRLGNDRLAAAKSLPRRRIVIVDKSIMKARKVFPGRLYSSSEFDLNSI